MSRSIVQFLKRGTFAVAFSAFWLFVVVFGSLSAGARQQVSPEQVAPQASRQGKSFASPEDAAAALYAAVRNNDEGALLVIFGPGAKDVIVWSDDPQDRRADHEVFARKYAQMHRLVKEPDGTIALYIGAENWPLPIPLMEKNGAWYFDIEAGRKEIMYRRIGRNELEAMEVSRALVDAEKDFYKGTNQYAQKFISSGSAHDGLYWADPAANSPIGPMLAHAGFSASDSAGQVPFHGYYYRILMSQGANAPGGARNYIVNGQMTGGFAILAFPAEYRSSGVMTFLVGQDGAIHEKDLGPTTDKIAKQTSQYDPDSTWKKSP